MKPRIELAALLLTVALHFACYGVDVLRPWFVALAFAGWGGYAVARIRADSQALTCWGLGWRRLRQSAGPLGLVTLALAACMAGIGLARGSLVWSVEVMLVLALYPVWGVVQQFLLQSIFAANLARLRALRGRPGAVIVVVSSLFALIHWPWPALMIATFVMGLAFTAHYLRGGSVWALGVSHGVLGTLFYFWVLQKEAWLVASVLG